MTKGKKHLSAAYPADGRQCIHIVTVNYADGHTTAASIVKHSLPIRGVKIM